VKSAETAAPADLQAMTVQSDRMFAGMNDDCVRLARRAGI
jgi:hypothetical protein